MADPARIELEPGAAERGHRAGHGRRPAARARGTLSLPAGTRKLEVAYTALDFRNPRAVRFRYRLEGFEKEWVDAGPRRDGVLHEPAARPLPLPCPRRQRGRRLERDRRREPTSFSPVACTRRPGFAGSSGSAGGRGRGPVSSAGAATRGARAPPHRPGRGAARRPAVPAAPALSLQHAQQHPAARGQGPRPRAADGRPARRPPAALAPVRGQPARHARRGDRDPREVPRRSSRSASGTGSTSRSPSIRPSPRPGFRASSSSRWSRTRSSTAWAGARAAAGSRSRRGRRPGRSPSRSATTARAPGRAPSTPRGGSACAIRGAASRPCTPGATASS